ncbi:hypothetical protein TI04_13670, partial [Achromatium sp. WMS2]
MVRNLLSWCLPVQGWSAKGLRLLAVVAKSLVLGFLFGILPNIQAGEISLPDLADSSASMFTPVEEQRLGRAFMRHIRQQLDVIEDPLLAYYLTALGQRLVSSAVQEQRRFYFFWINRSEINAFAGPDGNIGVYSGLMLASE